MSEMARTMLEEAVPLDQRIQALIQLNSITRPMALKNIDKAQETQKEYYDKRHETEVNTTVQSLKKIAL